MKLVTKEIEQKLPKLYSTEKQKPEDKRVAVKFFDSLGAGRWYAVEGEKEPDGHYFFFGYVTGLGYDEWGYFSTREFAGLKNPWGGNRIERDMHFGNNKTQMADVISGKTF